MSGQRRLRHLLLLLIAMHAPAEDGWIPMPLLTAAQHAAGIAPGGEGSQWPRGPLAVSAADPDFLLLPIDVGGVYRSLDGGRHWEIAMVGWDARGANGFAIDPRNAHRAVGIAANSMVWDKNWGASPHGLYLTTDQAASWHHCAELRGAFGGTVAYDATSFDAARACCTIVYYLALASDEGLLRSRDGGASWSRVAGAPDPGVHAGGDWSEGKQNAAQFAVDASSGEVYLAGEKGLFRSRDQGASWTTLRTTPVFSLALTAAHRLLISDPAQLWASDDQGASWTRVAASGLDTSAGRRIQGLCASPADPLRLLCWTSGSNFVWPRYVSHDGGASFQVVTTARDGAILPLNGREGYATWSPRDAEVAWGIGGDWVTRSVDGGESFRWSNNGYNGIMAGGTFNFSSHDPDCVFIGFQDYNGASTRDGGRTWAWHDVSGKGWGGHEYGGFALNRQVMWSCDGESWSSPRHLRLSRDGGATWSTLNGADGKPLQLAGAETSLGDPADPKIAFAANLRTADGGATWQAMVGCSGVYAADPVGHALFGVTEHEVVTSTDHGATWTSLGSVEGGVSDLAYDQVRAQIYVASQDRLKVRRADAWVTLATPADQFGNVRVITVATDPRDPAVVYVGGPRNIYASQATISRSTDAGATWTNLTVTAPLSAGRSGGPHEVSMIRVHPRTREAWVAGQCYGLWRIGPPAAGSHGLDATAASARRAVAAPVP